ncbi:iron chelate uptake ABC transporter family permease subunit, partial [Acidovorax sp.]|uniref:iron chelate uptake ABC transporter family permease subunit n=1 Tax=Acidovorax sp. TaxID=1872122 RepID=UPI004037D176
AGAVVTYVGAIPFVCLIVPHTARALLGRQDLRLVLPLAGLLGGVLMLLSDALSRLVNYPFESPVGIVTALIGAPFFLYLTWKQRR